MGNVYSALLASLTGFSGDSAPVVVPVGERWVLRQITVWFNDPVPNTEASVTGLDGVTLWRGQSNLLSPGQSLIEGRWVIEEGNFFQCHATFSVDFYISGYRLSLP